MTSAKGSLDFLSNECVVGTALSVERTYFGEQLASGEGVTLDYSCQQKIALLGTIVCLHWAADLFVVAGG